MNKVEELLKQIGGKESKMIVPGIDYPLLLVQLSVNGVCASWCLEDIKGDGVSYNLFRKKMEYWIGYNPNPNGKYFWDISKITETEDEMEFDDTFNLDEKGLSEWLEKEFKSFLRDKKINDILN
jgi:hypothetical protein